MENTKYGKIVGLENNEAGIRAWLGVPYAKPPVGELRWKAPRDPEPWNGVREATRFAGPSAQFGGSQLQGTEDCLYLNLWRPATSEKNLPVFVFVHGGGNFYGSGEMFKGDRLAKRLNAMVISLNYRLGVLGWLNYSALKTGDPLDDSGNFALLDVFKALEWVRDHCENFGGDPENVTLAGQSAGARNVMAAIISPLSKGLFHKAVALSGGLTFAEPEQGESFAHEYVQQRLIQGGEANDDWEASKWLDWHSPAKIGEFLRKQNTLAVTVPRPDNIRMAPFPHLFKDGYVIPRSGAAVISEGKYQHVPMILGSMAREFSYYTVTEPYFAAALRSRSIFQNERQLKLYRESVEFGGKLFAGFVTERIADILIGDSEQPPVYAYRFSWGRNEGAIPFPWNQVLGAAHAADVDFYTGYEEFPFQKLFPNLYYTEANRPGRERLSRTLAAYLKNFIIGGDPNGSGLIDWRPWPCNGAAAFLELGADAVETRITMVDERFAKPILIQEMKAALSADEWNILSGKLFKGRFFWEY